MPTLTGWKVRWTTAWRECGPSLARKAPTTWHWATTRAASSSRWPSTSPLLLCMGFTFVAYVQPLCTFVIFFFWFFSFFLPLLPCSFISSSFFLSLSKVFLTSPFFILSLSSCLCVSFFSLNISGFCLYFSDPQFNSTIHPSPNTCTHTHAQCQVCLTLTVQLGFLSYCTAGCFCLFWGGWGGGGVESECNNKKLNVPVEINHQVRLFNLF